MSGLQAEIDAINRACGWANVAEEEKMIAEALAASAAMERKRLAEERAIASQAAEEAKYAKARMIALNARRATEEHKHDHVKGGDDLAEAIAASLQSVRLHQQEDADLSQAIAESAEMLVHMKISGRANDIYDALVPLPGEIKLMCPWCRQPQVMEINCGIAHCGAHYVNGVLTQLPPHGPANVYAGRPFVIGGCGRQYMYNRATKQIERCAGK